MTNHTLRLFFYNCDFSDEPLFVHLLLQMRLWWWIICGLSSFRVVALMTNQTWTSLFFLQLWLWLRTTFDISSFVVSTLIMNHIWCFFFCNYDFSNEPHIVHLILQFLRGSSSFRVVPLMKNHTWNIFLNFYFEIATSTTNHTWHLFFYSFNFDDKPHLVPLVL